MAVASPLGSPSGIRLWLTRLMSGTAAHESAPTAVPAGTHAHPGWFGAVMSTAVLSVLAYQERTVWDAPWLSAVAVGLLIVTSVLALALAPRYARSLVRPGVVTAELGDPDAGSLLATVPAGILLLAAAWGTVGPLVIAADAALAVDAVLAVIGGLLAVWVGMMWNTSPGRGSRGLAGVNGSWLIPPVCTMLVALAIAPLVTVDARAGAVLLLVAFAFLGAGLVLFVVVLALLVARLVLHPDVPATLAPTMWIPLAPAGVIGIAAIRLTDGAIGIGLAEPSMRYAATAIAALGFGFGLWWALFAALDLARLRRRGGMAFHPGWWAFVFPPAALLLSLIGIEELFSSDYLRWVSGPLCLLLLVLWGYVAARSLPLMRRPRPRTTRTSG